LFHYISGIMLNLAHQLMLANDFSAVFFCLASCTALSKECLTHLFPFHLVPPQCLR
jgi:hypothetical protein